MSGMTYEEKLFRIGAWWNWGITVSLAVGYPILFPIFGMELPTYPVFFLLFLGVCFVLGVGYHWVSKDLSQHLGIVRLGIAVKGLVVLGCCVGIADAQLHWVFGLAGLVDLVFAVLFGRFLKSQTST
jgi:hypothetical protein